MLFFVYFYLILALKLSLYRIYADLYFVYFYQNNYFRTENANFLYKTHFD